MTPRWRLTGPALAWALMLSAFVSTEATAGRLNNGRYDVHSPTSAVTGAAPRSSSAALGHSPAAPPLVHGRQLALGDSVQGCAQTNPLPPLNGISSALSWEVNRCGSWFTSADGQRYQPCFLGCALGTFADASTEFSNSTFWCGRADYDRAVACSEPASAGGEWTCPGCYGSGVGTLLGCGGANRTCLPNNEFCVGTDVQGRVTYPRSSYDAAPYATWGYLRCNTCAVPSPRPGAHINPSPTAFLTNNYRVYGATFKCAEGYYGAPVSKSCLQLCTSGNTSTLGASSPCSADGGGDWDGGWPVCSACVVPNTPPGERALCCCW